MRSTLSSKLLAAASIVAMAPAAWAQGTATETVVVTGSRVISDAANSPTPLVAVTTAQLQATTPTDIPDALNKLPIFAGSSTQRSTGNASANGAGNVLNLRNFGVQRTLVLLDGHRVPASNINGTTDIDSLPQMLMSRVDVVTGGASAVYGSDAVTGVVNFILDKHFNGVKYNINAGIAGLGVGANYQFGVAAGMDLFGGHGHIEMAARHFNQDVVAMMDLPYGPQVWGQTGNGTTTPITATPNVRQASGTSFSGYIVGCGTGCTAINQQFVAPGVIGPFTPGTATATGGIQSGGDAGYGSVTSTLAGLRTDEFFGRFSYDLDNTTTAYLNVNAGQSRNQSQFFNASTLVGPNTFFKSNAFLPAAAQAALSTGSGATFTLGRFYTGAEAPGQRSVGINGVLAMTAGMDGTLLGKYDWDVYYSHGQNRLTVNNINNTDSQKLLAAEDAVLNSSGQVVCWDTTPAAGAAANAAYAGCIPVNPFGPGTLSKSSYQYWTFTTAWHQTNVMDNVGGSISGEIFDLPAGPIKAAVSAEARWLSLTLTSNAAPTQTADCTGLRLCAANTVRYPGNTLTPIPTKSMNVWEFSGELNIPLLKDAPLVKSLDANLAGRYTDYSASGAVQTWKIGLDYHVMDDVRLRATTSIDIRAPTLNDLFGPPTQGPSGITDLHIINPATGQLGYSAVSLVTSGGGNPNLVPEVARTYTAGVVFTPTFIPDLTLSVDWYQIHLSNAIGSVNGNSTIVQNLCEASNGTSAYCSLYIRPLPFSDRSVANVWTNVLSQSLNATVSAVSGIDMEANYRFELGDIFDGAPGSVSLRELISMQPVNESQNIANQPFTYTAQPKTRSTSFINYQVGSWTFGVQNRWISGWKKQSTLATFNFAVPRVNAYDVVDLSITKKIEIGASTANVYLSVENITNGYGPLYPTNSQNPGFAYPVPGGYPTLGRVFTLGVRGEL